MGTAMGALGKVCALPVAALLVGAVTAGTSTNSTSLGNARISLSETGDVVVAWDSPAPPSGTTDVQPFVRYTLAGAASQSSNASKVRSWQGRIWSAAELKGLRKGATYTYQCSSADGKRLGAEQILHVPSGGTSRLLMFGGLSANSSGATLVESAAHELSADAVVHLGHMTVDASESQNSSNDNPAETVPRTASSVPYMTCPGVHDITSYRHFQSILLESGTLWYSFVLGPMRIIMIWSDAFVQPGLETLASKQHAWLEVQLAHANTAIERQKRPWIIVAGHRPMYCSIDKLSCAAEAAQLRSALEPLFLKEGVDLYMSARLHAYERTFPVRNGAVCNDLMNAERIEQQCGPIYVVNGDAGEPPLEYQTLPARWTAQRHPGQHGFGEVICHNETHLHYRQILATGAVSDEFWLVKAGDGAPPDFLEENFLEAIFWLAFTTAVVTGSCAFVRWAHGDGLKRRDDSLRILRLELAVLNGPVPKAMGTAREATRLIGGDTADCAH